MQSNAVEPPTRAGVRLQQPSREAPDGSPYAKQPLTHAGCRRSEASAPRVC